MGLQMKLQHYKTHFLGNVDRSEAVMSLLKAFAASDLRLCARLCFRGNIYMKRSEQFFTTRKLQITEKQK